MSKSLQQKEENMKVISTFPKSEEDNPVNAMDDDAFVQLYITPENNLTKNELLKVLSSLEVGSKKAELVLEKLLDMGFSVEHVVEVS